MKDTNNGPPLYAAKLGVECHKRFSLLWALKRLSWGHVQRYEGSFPTSSTSKCYVPTLVRSSHPGRTKLMHSLYHTSARHYFVVMSGGNNNTFCTVFPVPRIYVTEQIEYIRQVWNYALFNRNF